MSWKNVKEHYRIGHFVHCIGSGYVSEIIVIEPDGRLSKRYDGRGGNEDLARYQQEMDADPVKLRELIAAPDTFTASIPVYTYEGGDVVEKQCEALGWPNVTHDGCMMYANTFSGDKAWIVAKAKENADIGIKWARERVEETEKKLIEARARLAEEEANRAKLEADFPHTETPEDAR
jgi:hypothetical protein